MRADKKKVVITGAAGFLGRHLLERIKGDNRFSIYALSSEPDALQSTLGAEDIFFLHKDAVRQDAIKEIMSDAVVVHCAYPRNAVGTAIADGLRYICDVFQAAIGGDASAIVNISSQSVYAAERQEAAKEDMPVCLDSSYAVGKYSVELLLEYLCRNSGTKYTNVRLASLIGPGFDQRIVNRFVKQAIEAGELTVKKNGRRFAFLDVEDAALAIEALIGSDSEGWKPVYNLGGNQLYTLQEIAGTVQEVVEEICGCDIRIHLEEGTGISNSAIDSSVFYEDFHFVPSFTLKDTVKRILLHQIGTVER